MGNEAELGSRTRPREELERVPLADRLASLGALTAGVLHDLNNPLTYVVANLEFATEEVTKTLEQCRAKSAERGRTSDTADLIPTVQEVVSALQEAQSGVEQVRAMLRELRELCRPDEEVSAPATDVAATLAWSVRMAKRQIRHRARIECSVQPTPPVAASAAHLGHVLLDLLVNAAEAIPEGEHERDLIVVRASSDDRGHIVVEVADQGCGIADEDRARIFDPFFTTKPKGMGTGLGLAACREIVSRYGGAIELESERGRGSTFRVVLPAAAPI